MRVISFVTVFTVVLTLLYVVASCQKEPSDSVDQDKIYVDYELFYEENQDVTYARATFRFSNALGTNLELVTPATVEFNGDVLTFNSVLAYYEKEYAGMISSGTFSYTDLDANTFTNSISLDSIHYPVGLDTIPRNSSFDLTWVGDPLSANEHVTLFVDAENQNEAQTFLQDDVNSTSIILNMNQLQAMSEGDADLYMDRKFSPSLVEKTSAGGSITGRFRPVNISVYLQ